MKGVCCERLGTWGEQDERKPEEGVHPCLFTIMAYLHSRVGASGDRQRWAARSVFPDSIRVPQFYWRDRLGRDRSSHHGGQQAGGRGVTSDFGTRSPAPVPRGDREGSLLLLLNLVAAIQSRHYRLCCVSLKLQPQ